MSSLRPMETDFNIFDGTIYQRPAPNFSYEYVPEGCCVRIHEYQQMMIHNLIIVDGLMIADGTVIVLD